MTRKLSLGPLPKAEPVKLTLTITTKLREDLERYAALHQELHGVPVDIATIAALMLETFLARDKGFRAAHSSRAAQRRTSSQQAEPIQEATTAQEPLPRVPSQPLDTELERKPFFFGQSSSTDP